MNDPHVVALFYNVKHSSSVDSSEMEPLKHEEEKFTITIENDKACFTMKADYATEEEAREAVKEYIQVWEIHAALQRGPNAFTLEFSHSEIEDRKPTPAAPGELAIGITVIAGIPTVSIGLVVESRDSSYPPPPPSGMKITPDVQSMYDRFAGYRLGKEPLASMAYFCLTVLEISTGRRQTAAEQYRIDRAVLDQIGNLSSEKGDTQARKAAGIGRPLTPSETRFLEEAIKALILRASEVAHDPNESRAEIKLTDLPKADAGRR